jgi:threonine dehydratase
MTDSFSFSNIVLAAQRLEGRIVRTPVLESPMLNAAAGCRVLVKAESLQMTGAFKFRGAMNKLLSLPDEVRARGIVAFSSGNHGHAVAAAAATLKCPAVIVLPSNAAANKIENCRWWGAEIVLYDAAKEDREEVGRRVAGPRGMLVVPPFDDYDIIAGQGTTGLELAQQLREKGIAPDAFIVPSSGGGLSSGSTAAMKHEFPELDCHFVEPEGLAKMAHSMQKGSPQKKPDGPATIMDGISGPVVGARTFAILRACNATGLAVTDDEALDAMAKLHRFVKIVAEPAGAAPLAAVLRRKEQFRGRVVALVCSGGNVDSELMVRALSRG